MAMGWPNRSACVWPISSELENHVGQQRARNVEQCQQRVIPAQFVDIKQHRARGVAHVRHMASAQLEGEPAVDRAKGQLALFRARTHAGQVLQQPGQLGGGKIGVQFKPGALPDERGMAAGAQQVAGGRGAPVLPHDGRADGAARAAVPQHRRFALIGNADGGNVGAGQALLVQHLARHGKLAFPDVGGIVFHPAGLRKMLGKLLLRAGAGLALAIEQDRARTGGALVEGKDVLWHQGPPVSGKFKVKQADRPDFVTARPLRFAL